MENLLYAIILLPLLGFLINGLFGARMPKSMVGALATVCVALPFIIALYLFSRMDAAATPVVINAFHWFTIDGVNIDFNFQLDQLSIMMVMIITGIGTLIHIYSTGYMHDDKGFYKFFAYLNLFIFNMLLLVLGGNYLILFIGWEGVGLCSYLLIGFWYTNKEYGKAARKAFIMNRIGDLGLLLGIFMIASTTNSLDYLTVKHNATLFTLDGPMVIFICAFLFVGAIGKSAQVPLYTWLPDAMAGPTPVSALIHAATMVTAGIYLIVRSNFLFVLAPSVTDMIMFVGLLTALLAAFYGLRQNDIKKVLAYSTVSQLGFMFVALGAGAYSAAMFHLLTHAFFKALLFLGSGSVIHAMGGEQDIRFMGGLKDKIKITHITFLIGTLAISGMPFFSGMISKDEILTAAFTKGIAYWVLLFAAATMTAVYMFRLYYLVFHGKFRGNEHQASHLHESPTSMTFPLVVLAVLSLIGGFINLPAFIGHGNYSFLAHWLQPVLTEAAQGDIEARVHDLGMTKELMLMAATVLMFFVVWFLMSRRYGNNANIPKEENALTGWERLSAKTLFINQIYNVVFVKTIEGFGRGGRMFDNTVLDPTVNFIGEGAEESGDFLKRFQNGNVENYVLIMTLAIAAMLIANLFIVW